MPRCGGSVRVGVMVAVGLLVGGLAIGSVPDRARAAGSSDLYPAALTGTTCTTNASDGSCRANMEWRPDSYGPSGGAQIHRRTLLSVYAQTGEVLLMGSSAVGVGSGDIVVYHPGAITDREGTIPVPVSGSNAYLCSAQRADSEVSDQGQLTTRAQEVGGPAAANAAGDVNHYLPCWFQVPSTGIYMVAFYGPDGANSTTNPTVAGDIDLTAGSDTNTTQHTTVAAWDLTVRSTTAATTDIPGRVFTYTLPGFTGSNGRPLNVSFYVTTLDGYRYRTDTRGVDPFGFVIYANDTGFIGPDGAPLNHDVLGTAGGQLMTSIAGGAVLGAPKYPLSFEPIATETLTALGIPVTPTAPVINSATFQGSIAGNNTLLGAGGTFTVNTNVPGVIRIVISRDGSDFDPGNPANRVLLSTETASGNRTVSWDGKDNTGTNWPAGNGFGFRSYLQAGTYHFPLLDAENSTLGGPTFTLLNPPGGTCPFGRVSCTTAFYDDRGYHTSVGDVGTPGSPLCGASPPSTPYSDPVTGFDSAGAQRAFGTDTGGSTNVSCTGSFGDVKGLDTWTFFPSNRADNTLTVLASQPPAPAANPDTPSVAANGTLTVAAPGVLSNDTGTALTVTGHTSPGHGSLTINANGSYSYTPTPGWSGTDSFTYTVTDQYGLTATGTVTIAITPVATVDSGTATGGSTLTVPAPGVLSNDVGTSLTVTAHTAPGHGSLTINANGSYSYTPTLGYTGADSFTYTITDAASRTAIGTVNLTVAAPAAPVAHADTGQVAAGQTLTVTASGVLGNDTGTGLSVVSNGTPSHGTASVSANGAYTYTPAAQFSGTDQFGYTITDAYGRQVSTTVTITVTPVAVNDTATTPYVSPVIVDVLANDLGAALEVGSVTPPAASTGTATVVSGGIQFTPALGFTGPATIDYTLIDSAEQTDTATLTVTVSTPDTPVAADDTGTTPVDEQLTGGVLDNDTGVGLTADVTTQPAHGTLTLQADGTYTYTPAAGYSGPDQFTYTVTDDLERTDTAAVDITVTPRAVADTATVEAGSSVAIAVLGNDHGSDLSLQSITQPAAGSAAITGSAVRFTAADAAGTTTFTYTLTDAAQQHATATVTITVTAPGAGAPDAGTGAPGTPVTVDPLRNDHPSAGAQFIRSTLRLIDPDTGQPSLVVTIPGQGTYRVDPATGLVTFTPEPGFTGQPAQIGYTVLDTLGHRTEGAIQITYTMLPGTGTNPIPLLLTGLAALTLGALLLTAARRPNRRGSRSR
jgi:CshA-type fibril repeat protein/VCBS repeat-containing protein